MKRILCKFAILMSLFFLFHNSLNSQTVIPAGQKEFTAADVDKANGFEDSLCRTTKRKQTLSNEEKNLLDTSLKWVIKNLRCQTVDDDHPPYDLKKFSPPIGKCNYLQQKKFGHFEEKDSLELVMAVSGGTSSLNHGNFYADETYILCRLLNTGFSAKVFFKDHYLAGLRVLRFPTALDLFEIGGPEEPCGPSTSTVYAVVNGEPKRVLTYECSKGCHQVYGGFETRLIPQENRDLKLLKLTTKFSGSEYSQENKNMSSTLTIKVYHWDSLAGKYKTDGKEMNVPIDLWTKTENKGD